MEVNQHRTWAEIDLGAIEHNYRVICEQAQAPVLCVVKADAYGHGAVQVAKRLEKMDAPYFAVATIPEGVELRVLIAKRFISYSFINLYFIFEFLI